MVYFAFLVFETKLSIAQAGLELMVYPPFSLRAGVRSVSHHAWLIVYFLKCRKIIENNLLI